MRIGSQSVESMTSISSIKQAKNSVSSNVTESEVTEPVKIEATLEQNNNKNSEEKLKEAIDSLNDFLKVNNKSSQFVLHEELDKYYVRLIDSETKEVVKEIPPKKLLDAFYEMQKLAGMIVDEKI